MVTPTLGKLTPTPVGDLARRRDFVAHVTPETLLRFGSDWRGYAGILAAGCDPAFIRTGVPAIFDAPSLDYLAEGDVVLLLPSGTVNVLYRRSSPHNTILLTERCNSFCLMCSQPPRDVDDSRRVGEILRLVELIDPATREIGLSGGEPTLLGESFLEIIRKFDSVLPDTALHVLTNGRNFKHPELARALAEIGHADLMLGIPLYSDIDSDHDFVVQAAGAYEETLNGLYNLARYGVRVEIRVVLHAHTVSRLPQLAEFIYRNLIFASHIALMGLEPFGFANQNFDQLWIDPADYADRLEEATLALAMRGMNVSIYNHQLCTLPRSVWPFARKSISDWKNVYLEICGGCGVRDFCGGFFHSATKRHSQHIHPLPAPSAEAAALLGIYSGVASTEEAAIATPSASKAQS